MAGLLASAACKGALFNVDINLGGLPDDAAQEIRKMAQNSGRMQNAFSQGDGCS